MRRGTFVSSIAMLALVWASTAGLAQSLPASGDDATARLAESPRHGEWVKYDAGGGDSVMAWVVYPERSERAPVVVVIQAVAWGWPVVVVVQAVAWELGIARLAVGYRPYGPCCRSVRSRLQKRNGGEFRWHP